MTVEGLICGQAMTKKMKKRLRLRMKKIVHSLTMSRAVKTTPPFIEVDSERRQQLRQTRDQLEELQDIVGGSEDVSDHKVLSQLEEKLNAYIQQLPVLGFNSGMYDLNASKEFLFPYLMKHQPIKFTVKRNNNNMCIKTDSLKFRDISNYFAPGFSYDQFPESVRVRTDQGIFPISVARQVGKARRNIAAPTRCLLLKSEER